MIFVTLVWLVFLPGAVAAFRALPNLAWREAQAVFVDEGRLVYLAPGIIGSFSIAPAEIAHARVTLRRRYSSKPMQNKAVTVVEVGRVGKRPKDIAAYAIEGTPETLAGRIMEFAAGRIRPEARSIVQ
jgi:hypothetical protein